MCSSEDDQVSSDLNQCFEIGDQLFSKLASTLEKRIRNLDKRHTKLQVLDDEFKRGKVLNEDQRSSLAKLPLIDGNIEMAKEVAKLIRDFSAEYAADKSICLAKKQNPKKEHSPKPVVTDKLCLFNAVLYSFAGLDDEGKSSIDYADLKISDGDLRHLRSFISLARVSSQLPLQSISPELPLISKHFTLLLDGSKECYKDNMSYSKLHKILITLSSPHNLKILDDLSTKPVTQTEDGFTQTLVESLSLPELKPASTNTEELPPEPPFQEPIPSQTIINQNTEDLSEQELLISSAITTEAPLIPTTVFLSKKSELNPEPIATPPQSVDSPDPTPSPEYPEQEPQEKSDNILSFPGMNAPSPPAQAEEAFDFLHDSEISAGASKPQSRTKPYPGVPSRQQVSPALFDVASFEASNPSPYLSGRLQEDSYKGRAAPANSSSMFPARHSPTNPVSYPDVMAYQGSHFKSKEQPSKANIQQYLCSNQKEMAPLPQAPKTISNSSLAQPYGNMLVENSPGGARQETPWDRS